MGFEGICMLVVLCLNLPAVQCGGVVLYTTTSVCGLKGASVELPCKYHYSGIGHYWRGEWYEERSGRVIKYYPPDYDCSLKIDKLTDDHSGVYQFRFYTTLHRSWIISKLGITVSVTDLKVKEVDAGDVNQTKVTCSTSCSVGLQYVWYKNGQTLQDKTTASIRVPEVASYSCAVKGYEALRSPAKCIPDKQCWGVTYSYENSCVLLGSAVDIPSTYLHPKYDSINNTFWFNKQKSNNPLEDLNLADEYKNHVAYLGDKKSSCTLRLKDIRVSYSGEYVFRFTTKEGESYSGLPGVNISVTALQMLTPPEAVTEGERVTLSCDTTCALSKDPTFIWYNNGQPVTSKHTTRDNKLHLNPVSEDAGSYSCSVKGHESLSSNDVSLNVRYRPTHVSVSISPSDGIKEGTSVTLTCSSDANPPVHNYTWYMKSGAESLVRGTGESISFNVTSDTSGLYYCEAQNEVGSQNSTDAAVPPKEVAAMILTAIITTLIILAVLLMLGILHLSKKKVEMTADTRTTNANTQSDAGLVYSTVTARAMTSDPAQRVTTHDQDDVQYANVQINRSKRQEVPLYSTVQMPQTSAQDDDVANTSVQFHRGSAATRAEDDRVICHCPQTMTGLETADQKDPQAISVHTENVVLVYSWC
ncbi:B-cell receptor CD22-like [Alosa pseudoharengus]|uniref:B-cell receptor CD22-like n=1 Tax=Alosa pseudoharengus TaxID=34774 RepID=UPI003F898D54